MNTNVGNFIGELEAGMFTEKLGHLISDVALGQVVHQSGNRKGKINIEFTFANVGDNNQVIISSKLSHVTLTKRGKKSEETVTETPMYVGKGGVVTIDPPKEEFTGQFHLQQVAN